MLGHVNRLNRGTAERTIPLRNSNAEVELQAKINKIADKDEDLEESE